MKRSKKTFILVIIFFFISSFIPNFREDTKSFIFPIKKVLIENNKIVNSKDLQNELSSLVGKNLLLIDHELIKSKIVKYDFVKSFRLKKIYPKTLKITIFEKKNQSTIPSSIWNDDCRRLQKEAIFCRKRPHNTRNVENFITTQLSSWAQEQVRTILSARRILTAPSSEKLLLSMREARTKMSAR